jgi:hypothetical protein
MITLPFVWTNKTTNLELALFHIQLFKLETQKKYKKCLLSSMNFGPSKQMVKSLIKVSKMNWFGPTKLETSTLIDWSG